MTQAELDRHRREGYANFHSGCAHCVKSRALDDQHQRADEGPEIDEAERVPVIGADLCFLGSEGDDEKVTVLVMFDSNSNQSSRTEVQTRPSSGANIPST